jgi:hypothetical protein
MLQDTATIETKYRFFIERTAGCKLVWALKDKKGWANSYANDDDETDVIPFWSDRAYAKACARDEWADYTPVSIPLPEFLENWCIGMVNDNVLAGINWDVNMFGKEISSLNVALDILEQLKKIGSTIKFTNYDSIEEFIADIKSSD